jgi:glycosyltransferase involved in cell wall biosynthesis
MSGPEIRVVIPLYNKSGFIKRALSSVLKQTFSNFEVIVVNDGSTDGSYEAAKEIKDNRIKVINQNNFGVSVARNNGVKHSRTPLVAFIDADDSWHTDFLLTVLRLNKRYPHAGAFATPSYPWEGLIPNYFKSALGQAPIFSSAVAVSKSALLDIGGFPPGVTLGEDGDTWLRLALKYQIAFSNYCGATYFQDAENRACEIIPNPSRFHIVDTALQALKDDIVPCHLKSDFCDYIAKYQIMSAATCIKMVRNKDALKILTACKTRYFLLVKIWWIILALLPVNFNTFLRNVKWVLLGKGK